MDAGVGYYQITTGVATDDDDFIVGGTGGLGIAPANGDIGELVKSYSITRGRSSELDRPTAGMATIVVDNPSAVFSPLNTTGCLSVTKKITKYCLEIRTGDGGCSGQ